jgi:hypothetical protein
MSAADYLLCDGCGRKVYYRNEAGTPGDELPDGAVLFCGDCAPKRALPAHVNGVVVATTEAAVGFTERVEWGVVYPNMHPEPVTVPSEAMARHTAASGERREAVRRTVYIGPWEAQP